MALRCVAVFLIFFLIFCSGNNNNNNNRYFADLHGPMMIDAEHYGGIARFANHCCWPNCIMQKWTVQGEPRLMMITIRTVEALEELTYNYGMDESAGEDSQCASPRGYYYYILLNDWIGWIDCRRHDRHVVRACVCCDYGGN